MALQGVAEKDRRPWLERLYQISAGASLSTAHKDSGDFAISSYLAIGDQAPRAEVHSTLALPVNWPACRTGRPAALVGNKEFIGTLSPGQFWRNQFFITVPEKMPTGEVRFQVANTLTLAGEKIFYPTEMSLRSTFLQRFHLIGPFDNTGDQGLDKVFPPEQTIDLKAEYDGKLGKVHWQKWHWRLPRKGDGAVLIDLRDEISEESYVLAYAVTDVWSERETDALFSLGTDDGCAVWLNGQKVHESRQPRAANAGEDKVRVHLQKGRNRILLKVTQLGGGWGFYFEITDAEGRPIPGLVNACVE